MKSSNKKGIKFYFLIISLLTISGFKLSSETVSMPIEKAKEYRSILCEQAHKFIGCPYVYGAHGPDKFDCSGLIYYIAKEKFKIYLPRTARGMYEYAEPVAENNKEPGDLVFFKTTNSGLVTHVGIYIGDNNFISALSDGPKKGVVLSSLSEKYWAKRYAGTRKFLPSGNYIENFDDSPEYDVKALLETLEKIEKKEITVPSPKPAQTETKPPVENKTPKTKEQPVYEEVVVPISSIIRNSLEKNSLLSYVDFVNKVNSVVFCNEQLDLI